MRRFAMPLLVSLLVLLPACGSDNGTGDNGGDNNPPATGMSATINGTKWSPAGAASAIYEGNIFSMAGISLTYGVSFAIGELTTTGTYSLDFGNQNAGIGIVSNASSQGWSTGATNGTGTVTFTTLTATHAVGTFSFDAVGTTGGATGTLHVTNGKFDITY